MRKLKIDEINYITAYYHQNGDNSAVTGGIGTEKLSDFANTFDVRLSSLRPNNHKNTILFELGVDHYSSASSDKIDPNSISSASKSDTWIYPSVNFTRSNENTGNSFGFTGSYSHEFDYQSLGAGFNLTRISSNKNTQFDFKLLLFWINGKLFYLWNFVRQIMDQVPRGIKGLSIINHAILSVPPFHFHRLGLMKLIIPAIMIYQLFKVIFLEPDSGWLRQKEYLDISI